MTAGNLVRTIFALGRFYLLFDQRQSRVGRSLDRLDRLRSRFCIFRIFASLLAAYYNDTMREHDFDTLSLDPCRRNQCGLQFASGLLFPW